MADTKIILCRRKCRCGFCREDIGIGEPIAVVQVMINWERKWTRQVIFHPNCWVTQGVMAAERKGLPPSGAGRKELKLTKEQKRERAKLLSRMSSLRMRINNELDKMSEDDIVDVDRLVHFGSQINELVDAIEPLGGAPRSWLNQ